MNGACGTVISGTLDTADLISALSSELAWLTRHDRPHAVRQLLADCEQWTEDSDIGSDLVDALIDALNDLAPANCYFGTHEEDETDYGFWPHGHHTPVDDGLEMWGN